MKVLGEHGARRVESRQNARVKTLRAGLLRGGTTGTGLIAFEGLHLLEEAIGSGVQLQTVFVQAGKEALLQELALGEAEILILPAEVFRSVAATEHPQGVAALAEAPVFSLEAALKGTPLVTVVAGLQDPGNLGTLVRSTEAFGGTGMILLPGTVSLWNSKTLRASSGSAFRLPVVSLDAEKAWDALELKGVQICATVARGGAEEVDLRRPSALLIGNEGAGLPEAWIARAHTRVTIPCPGAAESLNAAVAGSVLLYEAMRQRRGRL